MKKANKKMTTEEAEKWIEYLEDEITEIQDAQDRIRYEQDKMGKTISTIAILSAVSIAFLAITILIK